MNRRDFLKLTAAGASFPLFNILVPEARSSSITRPMNLVIFITDQERSVQHFPPGWGHRNLITTRILQRNGLTFNNAFCPSAMCSPSRASLFTGLFPAQHQVKDTLEHDTDFPAQQLPFNITNLAKVMRAAGYEVVMKGKWHLSMPEGDISGPNGAPDGERTEADFSTASLRPYGITRWDPPDAGENQDLDQFGGGYAANDRRFLRGFNSDIQGQEGAIDYINRRASRKSHQPFCLIVSLVNPHDVLSYPKTYIDGGYTDEWLKGDIELPETWDEDLSTKPTCHRGQKPLLAALGVLKTHRERKNYLNFYGNLMRFVDLQLLSVYRALKRHGLIDDTLIIRTSDHGEMGLAHGGLRQKNFNCYEETLKVPLIFSNPHLFPHRYESDALVSHVDLVPTLASLFKSPESSAYWQGVDYSHLITHKGHGHDPQDYVAFTFDDIRTGQNLKQTAPPPNRIVAIREKRYKFARYFDGDGNVPDQYEMYDHDSDSLEVRNLGYPKTHRTQDERQQFARLLAKLDVVTQTRLKPLKRDLIPKPRLY